MLYKYSREFYDYSYKSEDGLSGHLTLIHPQLGKSTERPKWSLENIYIPYIYNGPNLQKYIAQALKCSRDRSSHPDNSHFTAEGILYVGYV